MSDLLGLVSFYISNSNDPIVNFGDVFLINKNGDRLKIASTEIRKNLPPMLTLIDDAKKKSYFNLDALKTTFVSAELDGNVIEELEKFKLEKINEAEEVAEKKRRIAEENALKIKQEKQAAYKARLEECIESHKAYLSEHDIEYKGYSIAEYYRKSHCFSCWRDVSTDSNYVCNACNSLICLCGKCLCVQNKYGVYSVIR